MVIMKEYCPTISIKNNKLYVRYINIAYYPIPNLVKFNKHNFVALSIPKFGILSLVLRYKTANFMKLLDRKIVSEV